MQMYHGFILYNKTAMKLYQPNEEKTMYLAKFQGNQRYFFY